MLVEFANNRLARQMASDRELQRAFGDLARPIQLRIAVLAQAATLADVPRDMPVRCHALRQDRAGQFAVVLRANWRLIFRPTCDPVPVLADGSVDLDAISSVTIIEVYDYH